MPPGESKKSRLLSVQHEAADRHEPVAHLGRRTREWRNRGRSLVTSGSPTEDDSVIFEWAANRGFAVLTNDLDFGAMLALTSATGPSVVQIRSLRLAPRDSAPLLIPTLRRFEQQIEAGCLLILQESSSRIRLLPLGATNTGEERSGD